MFNSQSFHQKNRRSISSSSQQNQKRSSMSILNIQDSSILNSQIQPSYHNIVKTSQQNNLLLQELLPTLKNKLIESYRVVRNHVKAKNYLFSETQLSEVYQGMSNGLKTLEKAIESANKIKAQLAKKQQFNSSSKTFKSPQDSDQLPSQKHGNFYLNNFISSNEQQSISQYVARIRELEAQIEEQRQKNSQEIRLMIQNHEEEMMFVQKEQISKISNIQKEHQQQIESILQAHKKKEQQIRAQSLRKVNQQIKIKIQNFRQQQSAKFEELIRQFQQKEFKYKSIVKLLTQKLTESRNLCQFLNQQLQDNLLKTKMVFQRLSKTKSMNSQLKNDHYLKLLYEKIASLASQQVLQKVDENSKNVPIPSSANPQPAQMPYCTMAIEQMFMKSDDSVMDMQHNNFEHSLESILQQLIWWNFFSQENEQNVINLFSIGRQRAIDENNGPSGIFLHTLYPLIVEKIKLTLGKFQSQNQINLGMKDSLSNFTSSQNPNPITEFSTQNVAKLPNNLFPIRYRNIQSIDELEVSDSMIYDEHKEEKEKRIIVSENFQNHSPIINYKGYQSPEYCDQSASFDVDLF